MKKTVNYRCITPDENTAATMAIVEDGFEKLDEMLRAICDDLGQTPGVQNNGSREAQMCFTALEDACSKFKKSMCVSQQFRDQFADKAAANDVQKTLTSENEGQSNGTAPSAA